MLRFIDGFDHYPINDILSKWTTVFGGGGAVALNFLSSYVNVSGTGRFTGFAATLLGITSSAIVGLRKTFLAQPTWIVGASINFGSLPVTGVIGFIRFIDGTTSQCEIALNTAGKILWTSNGVTLATGTTTIAANTYNHVEVKVTIANSVAASSCILKLNGVTELTLAAGADTQVTANASATTIEFQTIAGVNIRVDDVFIADATGTYNNDMLGDCRVECLRPSAAGNSASFTPLAGSNYAQVNETTQDGDTSYVASSTPGHVDTYAMGDLASTPAAIYGLQSVYFAKKDDAGARAVASVFRSASVDYPGTAVGLSDSYVCYTEIRERDPNGSVAWTPSNVNALEAGVKLVS